VIRERVEALQGQSAERAADHRHLGEGGRGGGSWTPERGEKESLVGATTRAARRAELKVNDGGGVPMYV